MTSCLKILQFFNIFAKGILLAKHKSALDEVIKTLDHIEHKDIQDFKHSLIKFNEKQTNLLYQHLISDLAQISSDIANPFIDSKQDSSLIKKEPNIIYESFIQHLGVILRERVYIAISNGEICDISYLNALIWLEECDLQTDSRFKPIITMAQKRIDTILQTNSPSPHGDAELILLIELYIIVKAFGYGFGSFYDISFLPRQSTVHSFLDAILAEYISLLCLVDINLALAHSHFVIERFERLGANIKCILGAIEYRLKDYFHFPAIRRRSMFNWQLHCLWNIPHFFNHPLWLELYPQWRAIFYNLLALQTVEGIDEAMYVQFFIYHICGNNFHTQAQWRTFCDEIDKVAFVHYKTFGISQGIYGFTNIESTDSQHTHKKTVIGILRDRLVANSPFKVEYSLLSNLLNDTYFASHYEIRIYNMNLIEKSVDNDAVVRDYEDLGIKVVNVVLPFNALGFYNSHLQKALAIKSAINADNVNILISPNNGYGISDFVFATRSANIQIYYSHGNFVYDGPCIDAKITHICQNKLSLTLEGYTFYGIPVKMLECFYNPTLTQAQKNTLDSIRAQYPKNRILLGTIGRLSKLHSREYWQCVIAIMQHYPKSLYLACGSGNSAFISECIMSCFDDKDKGRAFLKRVHFVGYVDSAIYGHIIDVWLDSFPLEQGESRIEYIAKGGISIVLSKQSQDARKSRLKDFIKTYANIARITKSHIAEIEKCLIDEHLAFEAFSPEDYITKACAIIASTSKRKKALSDIIKKGRDIMDDFRQKQGVMAFCNMLQTLESKQNNTNANKQTESITKANRTNLIDSSMLHKGT